MNRSFSAGRILSGCALTATGLLVAAAAHAEIGYELAPTSSVGATTNAEVTTVPVGDAVVTLSNIARLRVLRPRSSHFVAYRLAWTRFIESSSTTLANDLSAGSTVTASATVTLGFAAAASISSTARTDFADPTTIVPQASQQGSQPYFAASVGQDVSYQPTVRWHFGEGLSASHLDYLSSTAAAQPPATTISLGLRADLTVTRNTFSLDARVTDFYVDGVPAMATGAFAGGNSFLGYVLLGWQRELSLDWTSSLSAGPSAVYKPGGRFIVQPSAAAQVGYRHRPWFATLSAAQTPTANLYTGIVTVNDQVFLRLALPLTRDEMTVLAGFGGFIYARTADAGGDLVYAYDQWTVGTTLTHRFGRSPFLGSAQYALVDQHGSNGAGGALPTLIRQTVMVSLTATFGWGAAAQVEYGGGVM